LNNVQLSENMTMLLRKLKKTNLKEIKKKNEKIKKANKIQSLEVTEAQNFELDAKDKLSIVFGANNALGIMLVDKLLERGRRVRVVVRNRYRAEVRFQEKLVEVHKINFRNIKQVLETIEKDSIIYNCVKVPPYKWFKNYPLVIYNIIYAAKKYKAKIVHVDNLTVYGLMKTKKLTERDPLIPKSDEGLIRKNLAEQIIIGHQRGDYEATIVRFPDFYGPYIVNEFSRNIFLRPLKNKPAKWFVDLEKKHSFIYVKDAAKALLAIGENPNSYGEIWHVAGEKPLTGKEFIKLVYKNLDEEPKMQIRRKFSIKFESIFDAEISRINDTLEQWEAPLIIDGRKFKEYFPEVKITPHKEAIAETLKWFEKRLMRKEITSRSWPMYALYQPYRW